MKLSGDTERKPDRADSRACFKKAGKQRQGAADHKEGGAFLHENAREEKRGKEQEQQAGLCEKMVHRCGKAHLQPLREAERCVIREPSLRFFDVTDREGGRKHMQAEHADPDGELDRMTQAMGASVSYNNDGTYNISYDLANATMSQSEAESYANMAQATLDDKNISLSDERRRQLTAVVDAYTSPTYQNANATSKIKPMRKTTPSNTSGGTGTPPGGTGHADPRSASNHPAPPAPGPASGPAPGGPGGGRRP